MIYFPDILQPGKTRRYREAVSEGERKLPRVGFLKKFPHLGKRKEKIMSHLVKMYRTSSQAVRSSAAATRDLAVRTGSAVKRAATSDTTKMIGGVMLFFFAISLASSLGHETGRKLAR